MTPSVICTWGIPADFRLMGPPEKSRLQFNLLQFEPSCTGGPTCPPVWQSSTRMQCQSWGRDTWITVQILLNFRSFYRMSSTQKSILHISIQARGQKYYRQRIHFSLRKKKKNPDIFQEQNLCQAEANCPFQEGLLYLSF